MTEVQEGLLKLFKEIDAICREHHLTYYLAGGCFIGALRNGGFLPWDDDADIHMPREDYLAFHDIVNSTKKNRVVISKADYPEYPQIQPRYIATDTTTMLRSTFLTETPQGQFVDILIQNPLVDDPHVQKKRGDDFILWRELSMDTFQQDSRIPELVLKRFNKCSTAGKFLGNKQIIKHLEKRLFPQPSEIYNYYLNQSPVSTHLFYPKADWGTPQYVPFEDTMLPIAEKPEKILRDAYQRHRTALQCICRWVFRACQY